MSALGALQQAQELHRGTQPAYTTDLATLGWPHGRSAPGAYTLAVEQADESGYRLVARAAAGGAQARDQRCALLALQVSSGISTRGSACAQCVLAEPLADPMRCWSGP